MTSINKEDPRYKSLLEYLHNHLEDNNYSTLKKVLLTKGWPEPWINESHKDILDSVEVKKKKTSDLTKKKDSQTPSFSPKSKLSKKLSKKKPAPKSKLLSKVNSKDLSPKSALRKKLSASKTPSTKDDHPIDNFFLSRLMEKKEDSRHFYDRPEYLNPAAESASANAEQLEVLKEAIQLAKDVVNSPRAAGPTPEVKVVQAPAPPVQVVHAPAPAPSTVQVVQGPASAPTAPPPPIQVIAAPPTTKLSDHVPSAQATSPPPVQVAPKQAPIQLSAENMPPIQVQAVFPGGGEVNKDMLDKEFEMQKQQLEHERENLKRERERLMDDQRNAMAAQTQALNIRVQNATISTENSSESENPSPSPSPAKPERKRRKAEPPRKSLTEEHLESKLELLEEKLKNIDYSATRDDSKYKNDLVIDEVEFVSEPVGDRAQTGISGLDPIIQGGFRRLTANMVAGGPGSGKTIFAMQYLLNGIDEFGENGIFITFEQSRGDLQKLFADFGWDLATLENEKKLTILKMSPQQLSKMLDSGGGSLRDAIDAIHASRIVIDSVSDFLMLHDDDMSKRRACIDLFELFAKMKCTSLVVSEQEVSPLKHISSVLEYQVDGVILLYNERVGDIRQRAVEIFKMRGTKHAGRIFPMKITDVGIMILSAHPLNKK